MNYLFSSTQKIQLLQGKFLLFFRKPTRKSRSKCTYYGLATGRLNGNVAGALPGLD